MTNDTIKRRSTSDISSEKTMDYAVNILCAYISKSECDIKDISNHLATIHSAVEERISEDSTKVAEIKSSEIQDTIHDDHIVCLEDGQKLKMLKRHLLSKHGLTIEEYKKKWNLSHDYPVVAPNYAEKRSNIAKNIKKKSK